MDRESKPRYICVPFLTVQLLVDFIVICIISVPLIGFFFWGIPHTQGFFCDDHSLQYPYRPETITTPILMSVGLGLPIAMIILTELVRVAPLCGEKRHRVDWYTALKGIGFFLFGTVLNKAFIQIIKYSMGRLRPNFFDVCKPDFSKINCSMGYITEYTCTNTELSYKEIRDSHLSFPSGHAAFGIFCGLYTALYLQTRFSCRHSLLIKPTLQAVLLFLAVWCGVTRLTDNKHFSSDVIAGFTYGIIMAWFVYYKVAWFSVRCVKFSRIPRSYSVSCTSEPRTPDPLLTETKSQFTLYLDDSIKTERSKSLI